MAATLHLDIRVSNIRPDLYSLVSFMRKTATLASVNTKRSHFKGADVINFKYQFLPALKGFPQLLMEAVSVSLYCLLSAVFTEQKPLLLFKQNVLVLFVPIV